MSNFKGMLCCVCEKIVYADIEMTDRFDRVSIKCGECGQEYKVQRFQMIQVDKNLKNQGIIK